MAMPAGQKVFIYILGMLLGILILKMIPRDKSSKERHPWHAQTAVEGTYPMTFVDDLDREVTLTKQPRWMVSLDPSITEMLFAMGMGDHLIAVSEADSYPEKAKLLRDSGGNLGAMDAPDVAKIKDLRPQMVMATRHTPPEVLETISNPPATVVVSLESKTIADIYEDIGMIGHIAGVPGKALQMVRELEAKEGALVERFKKASGGEKKTVLFLSSLDEGLKRIRTVGRGTWIDEVIERAQGRNIADKYLEDYGELALKVIFEENPDCILMVRPEDLGEREVLENRVKRLEGDAEWSELNAVRSGKLFWVEAGPFEVLGPRFVEAIGITGEALWD